MERLKIAIVVIGAIGFIWMFLFQIENNTIVLKQKFMSKCIDVEDITTCDNHWRKGKREYPFKINEVAQ